MKQALYYCLKIWLTSVVTGPVIFFLFSCSNNYTDLSILEDNAFIALIMAVIGFIFSMPSMLLLWLATIEIKKRGLSVIVSKVILSFAGAVLTLMAGILCSAMIDPAVIIFSALYMVIVITGIWIFKLSPAPAQ